MLLKIKINFFINIIKKKQAKLVLKTATTIEKVKFCFNFNIIGNKIKNRIEGIVITIVPNDKSITF